MSKIKNGGLDKYDAEPFERQKFGTAAVEGVKIGMGTLTISHAIDRRKLVAKIWIKVTSLNQLRWRKLCYSAICILATFVPYESLCGSAQSQYNKVYSTPTYDRTTY